jgi:hypothetical protein
MHKRYVMTRLYLSPLGEKWVQSLLLRLAAVFQAVRLFLDRLATKILVWGDCYPPEFLIITGPAIGDETMMNVRRLFDELLKRAPEMLGKVVVKVLRKVCFWLFELFFRKITYCLSHQTWHDPISKYTSASHQKLCAMFGLDAGYELVQRQSAKLKRNTTDPAVGIGV